MQKITSKFRKWDLHIHTPLSHLNQDFSGDFDNYFKNLFNAAIENDIEALGITDYFTIDGYKIICNYLRDDKKLKAIFNDNEKIKKVKRILVLPNIELRLDFPVNNNKAVFHIIFSQQVSCSDIEEKFLHKLCYVADDGSDRKQLTINNMAELGTRIKQGNPSVTGSELKAGMANIALKLDEISEILNKEPVFNGKYLFFTPCYDDVSRLDWNEPINKIRMEVIKRCDFLLAWDPTTIQWAQGLSKPYLHGCDAHIDSEICYPCVKKNSKEHNCKDKRECDLKFCWLNAELSFEGLKQGLSDPAERIKIQ